LNPSPRREFGRDNQTLSARLYSHGVQQTGAVRVCVIFNPAAKGDKARRFRRHLDLIANDCALKPTTAPGLARALAAEAVRDGFDTIVAGGGDGTINEVLNGIGDVPTGFARARLGILPLGTANVFARELRLPLRLTKAWDTIRCEQETVVDLAQAEYQNNGETQRRYFVQLAGAGLDALAVELVDWELKKKAGFFSYVIAGLRALRHKQPAIRVETDTGSFLGEQVAIGNGRLYGGPFVVFPDADLRDGSLDICLFPRVTWITVVQCCWGILTRRLATAGGARHLRAAAFRLTCPARTLLQLDGELVGELPATISVATEKLRVVVP
jgi:YegS/Rv2252/BmrU family lipid kinase